MFITPSPLSRLLRSGWLCACVCAALFPFATASAQEADEQLNVSFQVYIWRTSTSVENLVGAKHAGDSGPPVTDDGQAARANTPPSGDVTLMYVPPDIYFYPDGRTEAQKLNAAEGRLSRAYTYKGANPLVFFGQKPQEGSVAPQPLGEVVIDPAWRKVLLLFLPAQGDASGYRILPLENSRERIPPGQALIYNFTGSSMACHVGGQKFVLNAGSFKRISLQDAVNFTLPIQLASVNANDEWEVVHRENIILNPNGSLLFLIHRAHGNNGLLRVLTLEN